MGGNLVLAALISSIYDWEKFRRKKNILLGFSCNLLVELEQIIERPLNICFVLLFHCYWRSLLYNVLFGRVVSGKTNSWGRWRLNDPINPCHAKIMNLVQFIGNIFTSSFTWYSKNKSSKQKDHDLYFCFRGFIDICSQTTSACSRYGYLFIVAYHWRSNYNIGPPSCS